MTADTSKAKLTSLPIADWCSSIDVMNCSDEIIFLAARMTAKNFIVFNLELITAIVVGHGGISPLVSFDYCLLWNYEEVLCLLESCPHVSLILSGHSHHYNHAVSPAGKHYVTLRGVIETPPLEKSWLLVDCEPGRLRVKAHDGAEVDEFTISL